MQRTVMLYLLLSKNLIHHIPKIKGEKSHRTLSIDTEKYFTKCSACLYVIITRLGISE